MAINPKDITHIIFDVDGTLYEKKREYVAGKGSVDEHHQFLRYATYTKAQREGIKKEKDFKREIKKEYLSVVDNDCLVQIIQEIPKDIVDKMNKDVAEKGGNSHGKYYANQDNIFHTSDSFFPSIINFIAYRSVLAVDPLLQETISKLKVHGHYLGILSNEIYDTVEQAVTTLGLSMDDFNPLLCGENLKGKKKPDKAVFERLRDTTTPQLEKVLYVGDDFKKDVQAPLECGMQAALVTWDGFVHSFPQHQERTYLKLGNVYQLVEALR